MANARPDWSGPQNLRQSVGVIGVIGISLCLARLITSLSAIWAGRGGNYFVSSKSTGYVSPVPRFPPGFPSGHEFGSVSSGLELGHGFLWRPKSFVLSRCPKFLIIYLAILPSAWVGSLSRGQPISLSRKDVRNIFARPIALTPGRRPAEMCSRPITSRLVTHSGEIVRHKRHKSPGLLSAAVEMCEQSELSPVWGVAFPPKRDDLSAFELRIGERPVCHRRPYQLA
jgi:hypothetical protein